MAQISRSIKYVKFGDRSMIFILLIRTQSAKFWTVKERDNYAKTNGFIIASHKRNDGHETKNDVYEKRNGVLEP